MVRSKCSSVSSLERVDVLLERGVVDQDVELAELVHGALHRVAAEFAVGDVARDRDAAAAFVLDRALRLGGVLMLGQVGDGHVGALAGEQHRHGAADAGIGAGDQCHLAIELA